MYMLECFLYFSEDKNELVRAMVKMNQDGQSTIAGNESNTTGSIASSSWISLSFASQEMKRTE